jgi:hypothetical protein
VAVVVVGYDRVIARWLMSVDDMLVLLVVLVLISWVLKGQKALGIYGSVWDWKCPIKWFAGVAVVLVVFP